MPELTPWQKRRAANVPPKPKKAKTVKKTPKADKAEG